MSGTNTHVLYTITDRVLQSHLELQNDFLWVVAPLPILRKNSDETRYTVELMFRFYFGSKAVVTTLKKWMRLANLPLLCKLYPQQPEFHLKMQKKFLQHDLCVFKASVLFNLAIREV